nr:hypothetical protein [Tanacetum cinerariifolium]
MYKLREDVRNIREELAEYVNSPSWNYPIIFYDDDEDYSIQYREYLEKFPDAVTTVLPTEEPEYSLSMGYEHLNTTPETESDEIIKSGVEKLVPIPRENEVTSEDKNECDVTDFEDSSTFDVCEDHSEILSDSNNDDISSDDDAFEDIEYVEASLPDSELVSLEEENERLTSVIMKNISDDSTNDPLMEEVDLFLASDNLIPLGIENFYYDSEGDIYFIEELLVDDFIPLPKNKLSDFDHNNPLFPRPPLEPSDVEFDFEPNSGEVILAVINNINELYEDECFDPGREIDVFANIEDDDYFPFMFVIQIFLPYLIYPEVSSLLLSAESEDTIFDTGISV